MQTKPKTFNSLPHLLLIFVFTNLCIMCDNPSPFGDLEFIVINNDGRVEDAEVSLFLDEESFNLEDSIFRGPSLTDNEGKILFFNLTDSVYFVNIVQGEQNNWESITRVTVRQTDNGFNNEFIIPISQSASSILAQAQGRTWQWTQVFFEGVDVTDQVTCLTDNLLTFFKGGKLVEDDGSTTCDGSPSEVLEGTWQFSEGQTQLILNLPDDENPNELDIISLRPDVLQVSQNGFIDNGNGEQIFANLTVTYVTVE